MRTETSITLATTLLCGGIVTLAVSYGHTPALHWLDIVTALLFAWCAASMITPLREMKSPGATITMVVDLAMWAGCAAVAVLLSIMTVTGREWLR